MIEENENLFSHIALKSQGSCADNINDSDETTLMLKTRIVKLSFFSLHSICSCFIQIYNVPDNIVKFWVHGLVFGRDVAVMWSDVDLTPAWHLIKLNCHALIR